MKDTTARQLRRTMGPVQTTAMVVGTIIGASIFVQPSEITGRVPSTVGVLLVWATAGVLTLFGSLVLAELASALPRTGGVYVFLREAFSPGLGFLWGWAMFWSMHSGIIAAIAVVFAKYLGHFAPLSDGVTRLVAIGGIMALSAVNYVGVKPGSALQTALTVVKVVAVVGMVVVGFSLGTRPPEHHVAGAATVSLEDFARALIAGLFAFGGWHMVTYAAEETKDAKATIPVALLLGTGIVTACYIALNAAYLYVLPLETVMSSQRVAADAADAVMGSGGAGIMAGLVVLSTFGALSGIILAGPRVYFAMAQDGLLFRWMGGIHPRFHTPHRALVLQAVWASVLVTTGTYRALFTRVVYTEWMFFGLIAVGLFRLRRRSGYEPSHRVAGFPAVPGAFAVSCAAIVIHQIVSDPLESAFGLLLVLLGLPVYHLWVRGHDRR